MARPQTLDVRADTAELGRVRRWVGARAAEAGLDDAASRRLVLAVDETVANAVEHGLRPGDRVSVGAEPSPGRLTVTVRYGGPRFDPTTAPASPAADAVRRRAPHGYGLHLIRSLADDVGYRWADRTNEVRLGVGR